MGKAETSYLRVVVYLSVYSFSFRYLLRVTRYLFIVSHLVFCFQLITFYCFIFRLLLYFLGYRSLLPTCSFSNFLVFHTRLLKSIFFKRHCYWNLLFKYCLLRHSSIISELCHLYWLGCAEDYLTWHITCLVIISRFLLL